jgi:GTP-binding protein
MNEKNIRVLKAMFHKSATKANQYPHYPYPEFAFFGRSNVGKSSLLGMLLSGLAKVKTSAKPGHTQTVNFFVVNDAISFADLPGFGFAEAPGAVKASFIPMLREYISKRENLKIAFLLIDIRRTPGKEEQEILEALEKREIPTAIVATKSDKLSTSQMHKRLKELSEELEISKDDIYPTSALKGKGKLDIMKLVSQFAER